MERQPKQGETDEWCDGGGNLQHAVFHEGCARVGQMHVSTGNEGGVQRRVIQIARPFYLRFDDWKHTRLPVAVDRTSCTPLYNLLRTGEVGFLWLPVVYTMTGHLMALVHDTLHHLWGILREVARAEEGRPHMVVLQNVEDAVGANLRDSHPLFQ